MISSPPKRRKTNRTVDASQTNQPSFNRDTRPYSHDPPQFLLPTQSSLVKSNPVPQDRAISRSPTRSSRRAMDQDGRDAPREQAEGRVFGLRDRKALRPSMGSTASPMSPLRMSPRRASGQVFAAPPRRVSRRIMPSDLAFGSPIAQKKPPKSAHTRDPPNQPAFELDGAAGETDAGTDHFPITEGFEEPELPPTPTQLGLEPPPGRRKGLMSSSPSTRQGKWARRRMTDAERSGPLKVKGVDAEWEADGLSGAEFSFGQTLFPEPVLKKQKLKRELSAQLQQLKDDLTELGGWTEKLNDQSKNPEHESQDLTKLIPLLTSQDFSRNTSQPNQPANVPISSLLSTLLPFSKKTHKTTRQTSTLPTNPYALDESEQSGPYHTAFASLDLQTHSNRVSASKLDLREQHTLNFSPPSPFPPGLYNVSVAYQSNPEAQSLITVSIPEDRGESDLIIPETLRHWMNCRLANPLLKLDVSSLCWGINRYWEAMVWRAQIWSKIESQHSNLVAGRVVTSHSNIQNDKGIDRASTANDDGIDLTKSDLWRLVAHLERSSMLFDSGDGGTKLHLSCTLTMNEWTSEPELAPEISIQVSSMARDSKKKIEEEARKVFHGLLSENKPQSENGSQGSRGIGILDVYAIVRATEGVLGVLFAEAPALNGNA